MAEEWRPVVGFPEYEVSNLGHVRSWKSGSPYLMKLYSDWKGYQQVCLRNHNVTKFAKVHRLVLDAFVGPQPKLHGLHKNDIKSDNRLDNLKWGTNKENHSFRKGVSVGIKLSEDDVRRIRQLRWMRIPEDDIAKRYGVSVRHIRDIIYRRSWKYV